MKAQELYDYAIEVDGSVADTDEYYTTVSECSAGSEPEAFMKEVRGLKKIADETEMTNLEIACIHIINDIRDYLISPANGGC